MLQLLEDELLNLVLACALQRQGIKAVAKLACVCKALAQATCSPALWQMCHLSRPYLELIPPASKLHWAIQNNLRSFSTYWWEREVPFMPALRCLTVS